MIESVAPRRHVETGWVQHTHCELLTTVGIGFNHNIKLFQLRLEEN